MADRTILRLWTEVQNDTTKGFAEYLNADGSSSVEEITPEEVAALLKTSIDRAIDRISQAKELASARLTLAAGSSPRELDLAQSSPSPLS